MVERCGSHLSLGLALRIALAPIAYSLVLYLVVVNLVVTAVRLACILPVVRPTAASASLHSVRVVRYACPSLRLASIPLLYPSLTNSTLLRLACCYLSERYSRTLPQLPRIYLSPPQVSGQT